MSTLIATISLNNTHWVACDYALPLARFDVLLILMKCLTGQLYFLVGDSLPSDSGRSNLIWRYFSEILAKWQVIFKVPITAKLWEIDICLLIDLYRKSTAKLHFILSKREWSKSGSFTFHRLVVCKGTELGMFYYQTGIGNHVSGIQLFIIMFDLEWPCKVKVKAIWIWMKKDLYAFTGNIYIKPNVTSNQRICARVFFAVFLGSTVLLYPSIL